MSVRIRMKRVGVKKKPYYRMVAIEAKRRERGRVLEILGHYNPRKPINSEKVILNKERVLYWLSCGAVPSDTVRSLLKKIEGINFGEKYIKKKSLKKSVPSGSS